MSRFMQWFVAETLKQSGWPRPKGLFRRLVVNTLVVDGAVQQALHIAVALGAGRPHLGAAIIADTFANNPWTLESTTELLSDLKQGEMKVAAHPAMPPWQALYEQDKLSLVARDIPCEQLANDVVQSVFALGFVEAVFWGINHEDQLPEVFEKEKLSYENTARMAIPHGLNVSASYPWQTLEALYEYCENFVKLYELNRQPLAKIPTALRTAPSMSRRLTT